MSSLFTFLLVVHVLVAAAMTGIILMQQSEGGGLASGSPSGLMSARGAANFLTRTTTILATLFVGISIALATVATINRAPSTIDTTLQKKKGVLDSAPSNAAAPTLPSAAPNTLPPLATAPAKPAAANPSEAASKKTVSIPKEEDDEPKVKVEQPKVQTPKPPVQKMPKVEVPAITMKPEPSPAEPAPTSPAREALKVPATPQ